MLTQAGGDGSRVEGRPGKEVSQKDREGWTHLKGGTLGLKLGCDDISLNSVSADSASPTLQHAFWLLARSIRGWWYIGYGGR